MNTKNILIYIASTLLFACAISCNKTEADITGAPAAVHLINAIAADDYTDINMNFTGNDINYSTSKKLSYWAWDGISENGLLTFGVPSNKAIPLIVTLAKDTTKPIFNQTISFNPGDIYSLFVGGKLESPSYVLHKDTISGIQDSLTAVRFINLSQDINSVSINLIGNPAGTEVAELNYKQITNFKLYSARSTDFSYIFEIRDAATGDFLTSVDYNNLARFRHVTLIIRGLKDSWPELEVVRMNNF